MFKKLTPDESLVKEWWKTWEKCKKEYPNDSWDDMHPLTDRELCSDDRKTTYPGFYIGPEHELYLFKEFKENPDHFDSYMFFSLDGDFKSQYGVADNPEQIIKRFKREYEDPTREFVVLCDGIPIDMADGNEKFYKNGPYIGKAKVRGWGSDYSPSKKTEEIKKNGYLIGYHIYPLPGTEPYPSRKYSVLKKYVMADKPAIKGDTKIEIINHGPGDFWRRNGDVDVRTTHKGEVKEEHMTTWCAISLMVNLIYYNNYSE